MSCLDVARTPTEKEGLGSCIGGKLCIVLALPVSGVKRLWLSILPLLKHECQLTGSVRDPNCLFDCDVELAAPAAPATAIAEHCLCVFKA